MCSQSSPANPSKQVFGPNSTPADSKYQSSSYSCFLGPFYRRIIKLLPGSLSHGTPRKTLSNMCVYVPSCSIIWPLNVSPELSIKPFYSQVIGSNSTPSRFLSHRCHGSDSGTFTSWRWGATPTLPTSATRSSTPRAPRTGFSRSSTPRSGTPAITSVRCPRSPSEPSWSTSTSSVSVWDWFFPVSSRGACFPLRSTFFFFRRCFIFFLDVELRLDFNVFCLL